MTAAVLPFNRYILTDVVASLRVLAEQIEHDPTLARRVMVCIEGMNGKPDYRAFGEDFTIAHAVGLCEITKAYLAKQVLDSDPSDKWEST